MSSAYQTFFPYGKAVPKDEHRFVIATHRRGLLRHHETLLDSIFSLLPVFIRLWEIKAGRTREDMEGSGRGLIKVVSRNLRKTSENLSEVS
jgi:hypothetical protein